VLMSGERYRGRTLSKASPNGTRADIVVNKYGSFTLREGDSVTFWGAVGDSCNVKAASVNGTLGIAAAAETCFNNPDIGCLSANSFIPTE
jgi:hypothetical protein